MARPVKHDVPIGMTFGRLVTLQAPVSHGHSRRVRVRCQCGIEKMVSVYDLVDGKTRSCGCGQRQGMTTHGATGTRLYRVWGGMRQRCDNPRATGFENYGGRGVRVCRAWQSFEKFATWATTHGYRDDLTLDRKRTNGNYQPSNCRFVRWRVQAQSHRKRRGSKTPYIGVVRDERTGRHVTYAQGFDKRSRNLGVFDDPFSAAWVRDTYVRRFYDSFATLNPLNERRLRSRPVKYDQRGCFDWNQVFNKWFNHWRLTP